MGFLAIDQRSNLEDGLYTGEEICAMLGENDGICGLGHVGVEMELDPEALSDVSIVEEEEDGKQGLPPSFRRPDYNRRRSAVIAEVAAATYETDRVDMNRNYSFAAAVATVNSKSLSKRSIGGKIQILKHMLLKKATSRIKTIAVQGTSRQLTLNARTIAGDKQHQSCNKKDHSDNSTCCEITHASLNSSSVSTMTSNPSGTSGNDSLMAPSSLTTSTCDFTDPNLHAVFESYLMTNPWDAAKKGDFATLSYIATHDDAHIWTQTDVFGQVPLYYACVSYSQSHGQSFGKYGLESVKLLVRTWPAGTDFPKPLLELLHREPCIFHEDVIGVLSKSRQSNTLVLPLPKEDVRIEGTKDVVPISFLQDLGDEGYDEDY